MPVVYFPEAVLYYMVHTSLLLIVCNLLILAVLFIRDLRSGKIW